MRNAAAITVTTLALTLAATAERMWSFNIPYIPTRTRPANGAIKISKDDSIGYVYGLPALACGWQKLRDIDQAGREDAYHPTELCDASDAIVRHFSNGTNNLGRSSMYLRGSSTDTFVDFFLRKPFDIISPQDSFPNLATVGNVRNYFRFYGAFHGYDNSSFFQQISNAAYHVYGRVVDISGDGFGGSNVWQYCGFTPDDIKSYSNAWYQAYTYQSANSIFSPSFIYPTSYLIAETKGVWDYSYMWYLDYSVVRKTWRTMKTYKYNLETISTSGTDPVNYRASLELKSTTNIVSYVTNTLYATAPSVPFSISAGDFVSSSEPSDFIRHSVSHSFPASPDGYVGDYGYSTARVTFGVPFIHGESYPSVWYEYQQDVEIRIFPISGMMTNEMHYADYFGGNPQTYAVYKWNFWHTEEDTDEDHGTYVESITHMDWDRYVISNLVMNASESDCFRRVLSLNYNAYPSMHLAQTDYKASGEEVEEVAVYSSNSVYSATGDWVIIGYATNAQDIARGLIYGESERRTPSYSYVRDIRIVSTNNSDGAEGKTAAIAEMIIYPFACFPVYQGNLFIRED